MSRVGSKEDFGIGNEECGMRNLSSLKKWSNVKVPHLAYKVCEHGVRSHCKAMYRALIEGVRLSSFQVLQLIGNTYISAGPNVAGNVRYIRFRMVRMPRPSPRNIIHGEPSLVQNSSFNIS